MSGMFFYRDDIVKRVVISGASGTTAMGLGRSQNAVDARQEGVADLVGELFILESERIDAIELRDLVPG